MISAALATEDELTEAVGQRLLAAARHHWRTDMLLRKSGAGYLRKKMKSWCEMAAIQPVVLITDLDQKPCAAGLIAEWLGERAHPQNLLFRVAVREVESWLLADHEGMQLLLGKAARLPPDPDSLTDPKKHLLDLARGARREIREDLIVARGAAASQGIGYNARLCAFIREEWDPDRAQSRSESLRRARLRIDDLGRRLTSVR